MGTSFQPIRNYRSSCASTRWTPPSEGYNKFNTDASLREDNTWGLGAVCRDTPELSLLRPLGNKNSVSHT